MDKYKIYLGAGNGYTSNLPLSDLMDEVEDALGYTQEDVFIAELGAKNYLGEEFEVPVAGLSWYGYAPASDEIVTASFGSFGYYGEWWITE